jgi:hypothetical protein
MVGMQYSGQYIRSDTAITYDFDDNFNRVALKKIISDTLPDIRVRFVPVDESWKRRFISNKFGDFLYKDGVLTLKYDSKAEVQPGNKTVEFELENNGDPLIAKFFKGVDKAVVTIEKAKSDSYVLDLRIIVSKELFSNPYIFNREE